MIVSLTFCALAQEEPAEHATGKGAAALAAAADAAGGGAGGGRLFYTARGSQQGFHPLPAGGEDWASIRTFYGLGEVRTTDALRARSSAFLHPTRTSESVIIF